MPAWDPRANRLYMLFQRPNSSGRSRHGLPVRAIHETASTNSRLSIAGRPRPPALPGSNCAMRSYWSPRNSLRTIPASQKTGCKQIAVEGNSAGRRLVAFGRQPLSSLNVEVCSCITCTAVPHLDAVAGEGSPSVLDDHLCTGKDITISICRGSENRSLATRRPVFPVFQG